MGANQLNGDDLRRDPLPVRKATLASILAKARPGIRFNEHLEGDGTTVFVIRWHRVEAARLALPLRPLERLAEIQEPGGTGGKRASDVLATVEGSPARGRQRHR